MRGRKCKVTSLKNLEGNPGKRPIEKDYAKIIGAEGLTCPSWLLPEAKKEWKRLAPKLIDLGILTHFDKGIFITYCQSFARFKQAEENIKELTITSKSGYKSQTPEINISQMYAKRMNEAGALLGLNPVERTRLAVKNMENREDDEMENILSDCDE